jgi:hypothetical protein
MAYSRFHGKYFITGINNQYIFFIANELLSKGQNNMISNITIVLGNCIFYFLFNIHHLDIDTIQFSIFLTVTYKITIQLFNYVMYVNPC